MKEEVHMRTPTQRRVKLTGGLEAEVPGEDRCSMGVSDSMMRREEGGREGGGWVGFEGSSGGAFAGRRAPPRRSSCEWHVLCLLRIPASTPTSS